MWILVMGSLGTAKKRVSEIICKINGSVMLEEIVSKKESFLDSEAEYLAARLQMMASIKMRREKEDLISIRSIWDSAIFAEGYYRANRISKDERNNILNLVRAAHHDAEKPDLVVYTYAPKIDAMNNINVAEVDYDLLTKIGDAYHEFINYVEAPMIDVDVTLPYHEMVDLISFGVDSVGSTRVSESTIWRRRFINEAWLEQRNKD